MERLHVLGCAPGPASGEVADQTARHPCFSREARHRYARMHLPVAPACNISCNYCNRQYDCPHESRPGVTSEVLTPEAAFDRYMQVKNQVPALSVVGIAGPGDALANWEATRTTIAMIKRVDPEMIFCLSTNGLLLPEYGREIIGLGIRHITVTVNSLDPAIGARIYRYVDYRGSRLTGEEGAELLLRQQLKGIVLLQEAGVVVKVNTVMIPGINERHIPDIARKMKRLGAYIGNIMPLIPAAGSVFQDLPPVCPKELNQLRHQCQLDLPQMYHCRQCRADAIGFLGKPGDVHLASLAGEAV